MFKMEIINNETGVVIASQIGSNDELTKWYNAHKDSFGDIYSYKTQMSDHVEPKKKWWKFGKDKSL